MIQVAHVPHAHETCYNLIPPGALPSISFMAPLRYVMFSRYVRVCLVSSFFSLRKIQRQMVIGKQETS